MYVVAPLASVVAEDDNLVGACGGAPRGGHGFEDAPFHGVGDARASDDGARQAADSTIPVDLVAWPARYVSPLHLGAMHRARVV
jgi:hypothetical protein